MDNNSNSGVSLILNPEIADAINDNHHQHDLSTCEEEFENQEEIQQMLANAFDSHSLSNTDNAFDDDEEESESSVPLCSSAPVDHPETEIFHRHELIEKHEQIVFDLRLDYERQIEQITNRTNEQQLEMITLKQMYETIFEEKQRVDEQIDQYRHNEQKLKVQFEQLQIKFDEQTQKPTRTSVESQTENNEKTEELTRRNVQLAEELTSVRHERDVVRSRSEERERYFVREKIRYEKQMQELSSRPPTTSIQIQTDPIDDNEKITKQLQIELDDCRLKINSKQMEINTLKLDMENLNDRQSLLANDELKPLIIERDQYLRELNSLKNELPNLKQQMIDSFQSKVISFKEQVKKSLLEKETDYRRKIQQIENEYIEQYEQVLDKNKQFVRAILASKQEEFNAEKTKLIEEYEGKFNSLHKQQQMSYEERRGFEEKIAELTRANEKCSQYISKRSKSTFDMQIFDETKRKWNDEIHRLYDQIAKQNQQQILLIDDHQQQIEQLKISYEQRYRTILDEWKTYNDDLRNDNGKLKYKLKEYEKTIVQLRYQVLNLQIDGTPRKIL